MSNESKKTLIGVLASNDRPAPNLRLISIFNYIHQNCPIEYKDDFPFHFVFTGGTYDRLFYGDEGLKIQPLKDEVASWLRKKCGVTRIKKTEEGGVILLTYLISQRKCNIVWTFFAPDAHHWQKNENLALTRLCDQWHAKRLMNIGSVYTWFGNEFEQDINRNIQKCPLKIHIIPNKKGRLRKINELDFKNYKPPIKYSGSEKESEAEAIEEDEKSFGQLTIALIAHNDMKARMVDFAIDHESELDKFGTILATGTTGREVAAATSSTIEKKMVRYHSGPKGGDIEIATVILYGYCDVVIFFIDPLSPHPHIDDIRVVFQACIISDAVVMITNEMHAREFMSRTVRGKDKLKICGNMRPLRQL